jgi:hypothetical protein
MGNVTERTELRGTLLQTAMLAVKRTLEEAELVMTARQLDALERGIATQMLVNRERRRSGRLLVVNRGKRRLAT